MKRSLKRSDKRSDRFFRMLRLPRNEVWNVGFVFKKSYSGHHRSNSRLFHFEILSAAKNPSLSVHHNSESLINPTLLPPSVRSLLCFDAISLLQSHSHQYARFSSIFFISFATSVALVVDVIQLNKIVATTVSDMVSTQSHLQMKFKCKLSCTPMNRPSVQPPSTDLLWAL